MGGFLLHGKVYRKRVWVYTSYDTLYIYNTVTGRLLCVIEVTAVRTRTVPVAVMFLCAYFPVVYTSGKGMYLVLCVSSIFPSLISRNVVYTSQRS